MSTKSRRIEKVLAEEGAGAESHEIPGALPE